ncbi:MAG: hypothetical protein U9N07_00850 [Euryarchaeota archaeon]|nr:hypothetical protein [Euryarchaeota archaeon]
MIGNSTEPDDKPCPLTVGEWIALLAAESQAKFGYKHIAVAMLLAACSMALAAVSIILSAYAATDFESFGRSMRSILLLLFCVAFAVLVYYAYRTKPTLDILMDVVEEKDKNSEIIEEIISGELTDSNEIRRRYHEQKNTHRPVRETDHRHPHETGQ